MKSKLILLFAFVIYNLANGQSILTGKVIDAETSKKVPYANINSSVSGTAADENGEFIFKISPEASGGKIKVSCFGYSSREFSIDSLSKRSQEKIVFQLRPFTMVLKDIEVFAKRVDPKEIVREAIREIPKNYVQQPFNMEFYSRIMVRNKEGLTLHVVETIVNSYRAGYVENGENNSVISEKRITGNDPLSLLHDKKRKIDYSSHENLPTFDIFLVDMIGVGKKYNHTVFNPDYFEKLDFLNLGISSFESDTVSVIGYRPKGEKPKVQIQDSLFISVKNQAVVKHVRKIAKIRLEISYRKWGKHYFPYFVKTVYPVTEKGKDYLVIHESYIRSINLNNVKTYDKRPNDWHLNDVSYNSVFWDSNYPVQHQ